MRAPCDVGELSLYFQDSARVSHKGNPPSMKHEVPPPTSSQSDSDFSLCDDLKPLVSLQHFKLAVDQRCRLVVAWRTPTAFQSVPEIIQAFSDVEAALQRLPRQRYVLLGDTRSGPTRNDPEYENAIAQVRGKLLSGFAKNATLAQSSAGKLQVQRYAKVDGREIFITSDKHAAFAYLGVCAHSVEIDP